VSMTPDAIHVADLDSAAKGLLDHSILTHQIASDPSEVLTNSASSTLLKASIQSIGANTAPTKPATDIGGVTAAHGDNDDAPVTSMQLATNPDFSSDVGYSPVSRLTGLASTNLGSGSLNPTGAADFVSNHGSTSDQNGVDSTNQLASKDGLALVPSPVAPTLLDQPIASTLATVSATTTPVVTNIESATNTSTPDTTDPASELSSIQPTPIMSQSHLPTVLHQLAAMHATPQQIILALATLETVLTANIHSPLIPSPVLTPAAPMPAAPASIQPASDLPQTLAAATLTGAMGQTSAIGHTSLVAPTHIADIAPPPSIIGIISDLAHHPVG
jgi:hypothetical protein